MEIAGLGISVDDWKDHCVRLLLTRDCNLRCPYCSCSECFIENKPDDIDLDNVMQKLKFDKKYTDRIVITGGEPTIHEDLDLFLQELFENNFYIKLFTNGTNPDVLRRCLPFVDTVSLDIKTSFDKYRLLGAQTDIANRILESISYLQQQKIVKYEFRTTAVPYIVDRNDMEFIGNLLKNTRNFIINGFDPSKAWSEQYRNIPSYSFMELSKFKGILENFNIKKIDIEGI